MADMLPTRDERDWLPTDLDLNRRSWMAWALRTAYPSPSVRSCPIWLKVLAQRIIPELKSQTESQLQHDSSTNSSIQRYRKYKG